MTIKAISGGNTIVRSALALAAARGEHELAKAVATARWGETSAVAGRLKSVVGSTDGWGEELVTDRASAEFFAMVAERSALPSMLGLRRTPLRVRMVNQINGSTASWVGEGGAVPASAPELEGDMLEPHRLGGMVIVTRELAESSDPTVEGLIRSDLQRALSLALGHAALWPDHGLDDAPEAIATDAGAIPATADPKADLDALVEGFEGDLARSYFVMSPQLGLAQASAVARSAAFRS
jgi:HK97 family phage major capsid protein